MRDLVDVVSLSLADCLRSLYSRQELAHSIQTPSHCTKLQLSASTMTFSAMFRSRRLASKAKANQSTVVSTESEVPKDSEVEDTRVNEVEDTRVDSFGDDRDEMNPLERFFSDAGSVFSGAVTEAASLAGDVKSVISADLDEEEEGEGEGEGEDKEKDERDEKKSTAKSTRGSKSKKDKSNEVKGSPSDLAREIKKLDKLERQVEKAEHDIMKAIAKTDKEIEKAEEEQEKSRRKIKQLTRKFELERFMQRDQEDFADERVRDVLKEGGHGIKDAGESMIEYIPRLVGSVNRTATKKIFPHDKDDADYE